MQYCEDSMEGTKFYGGGLKKSIAAMKKARGQRSALSRDRRLQVNLNEVVFGSFQWRCLMGWESSGGSARGSRGRKEGGSFYTIQKTFVIMRRAPLSAAPEDGFIFNVSTVQMSRMKWVSYFFSPETLKKKGLVGGGFLRIQFDDCRFYCPSPNATLPAFS